MIVSSFYKYTQIKSLEPVRYKLLKLCIKLTLKGKILIAKEGINGCVSGEAKYVENFKNQISKFNSFNGITFKDTLSDAHPYKKMIVRLRPEIVNFSHATNLSNKAEYVSPRTLRRWIQVGDVLLVDARNDYESRIGRFKGAFTPKIKTFREWPQVASELKPYKSKKIVTYCTGGVRCEKASAYLKENGFEQVYQLEDGILNYIEQFPDADFEGRCFVFDNRLSVPSGAKSSAITNCDICHYPCDSYINCKNVKCDKMFISCSDCKSTLRNTCSKKCRNIILEVKK